MKNVIGKFLINQNSVKVLVVLSRILFFARGSFTDWVQSSRTFSQQPLSRKFALTFNSLSMRSALSLSSCSRGLLVGIQLWINVELSKNHPVIVWIDRFSRVLYNIGIFTCKLTYNYMGSPKKALFLVARPLRTPPPLELSCHRNFFLFF